MKQTNFIDRSILKLAQLRGLSIQPVDTYSPEFAQLRNLTSGVSVNHDTAMKFTAVFAAIRIRSENIASLPKSVQREKNGTTEILHNHPVQRLIHRQPNTLMNAFTFWEFMNANLDGWGNAIAVIERSANGDPANIWHVHPSDCTPTIVNRKMYYKISGEFSGVYSSDDILHFKLFTTREGKWGIDPIRNSAEAISLGLAAQKFNSEFFAKGGHHKGVYETDSMIGDEEYSAIMKHLAEFKNFETPILEGGLKYKQISISPEAAQLIQQRTFSIQDIARIFNLPPHMLAELSRSTFSNIEHQDLQFVKYSLRPTVKRIEEELETKLFYESESEEIGVKFNLEGLLRGAMASRAAFYHYGIQDGWLNRNEVRNMENLNAADGLDDFLYPANLNITGNEFNLLDQSQNNQNNSQS
jgi:HK97 family phage portal protein